MFKKGILLLLLFAITACSKDSFNQQNTLVPSVAVSVPTNNLAFISTPGSFEILYGQGYNANGIIVFNIDNNTYLAFDLTCPHINVNECSNAMAVNSQTGEMTCNCGADKVVFTQFRTSTTVGENTYHLRQYRVILQGNQLRVTNF